METTLRDRMEKEMEPLQRVRDELRLQIHLGETEAQDTWKSLDSKWHHLEARIKRLGHATLESAEEVEEAAKLLVEEIRAGYGHIRDSL